MKDATTKRRGARPMSTVLFVPLKRVYFEQFRAGTKTTEYRPYGPHWNERVCWVDRRVTLSLGYGTAHRMAAVITSFRTEKNNALVPGWLEGYGADDKRTVACIGIALC